MESPVSELMAPVLPVGAEQITADLLLAAMWSRLSEAAKAAACALTVLRRPAPRPVIDALGSAEATGELMRAGVLIRFREQAMGDEALALTESDQSRAVALHEKGKLLRAQGKYREAETLFRQSLTLHEKAVGTEDSNYGGLLQGLAIVLRAQGKSGEAEVLLRQSLALYERALGVEHHLLCLILTELAAALSEQGRPPAPAGHAVATSRGRMVWSGGGTPCVPNKLNVNVADDHQLAVTLPEDFPPGPAEGIVLAVASVTPEERRLARVLGSLSSAAPSSVEGDPVADALAELRDERARRFDASEEPERET
ncbi:tetratricopeptide repeat protein [Sorangium sp. So ce131]|uniref:tetratricopeptide repeat protein n=1 Tax=Sorangium sp. So ce131 TaxID=3133282 RepID=UPI003F5DA196